MLKEIVLPDLGEGIDGAEVSEVPVAIGDNITKDQTVLVLESDKASMEIPSECSGKILNIFVSVGDEVNKGQFLFTIETQEGTEKIKEEKPIEEIENKIEADLPSKTKTTEPDVFNATRDRGSFASPGVRRLARELQINLSQLSGTGPKGRITKNDLHSFIKLKMVVSAGVYSSLKKEIDYAKWGKVEVQKLTKINKITGKRLQKAWREIPHVTQHNKADLTALNELRKKMKEEGKKKDIKVTFLPFFMKAVVVVLKEMPVFNSSLDSEDENLILKEYYNIGVAIDTPGGLVVPTIKDVDKKTVLDLSKELVDISEKAREKKLKPDDLSGGSFTISSLGGIGGTYFSPIVNPPEVAILGISKSEWRQVYNTHKEKFIPRYILPLSLSYDHRVIDGADGARFVERLANVLNDINYFLD